MKNRKNMKKMLWVVMLLTCNSIYALGTLVYLTQGNSGVTETIFQKYSWSEPFFACLQYVFVVTVYFQVPFYIIAISEFFEDMAIFRKCMKNSEGELRRVPLVLMRLSLLAFCMLFLLASSELTKIFSLGGEFLCPIFISFPV